MGTDNGMKITTHSFGTTRSGAPVTLFRLMNRTGAVVEALDYGCTIRSIRVPDRDGRLVDTVLGYDTLAEYETHDGYLGALIGRCANRIANARLSLNKTVWNLTKNDGPNHLHGGWVGFDKQVWDARVDDNQITFTRCSPAGEEGYPGALYVRVTYTWGDDNVLTLRYEATTDAPTVVNLTNHSYFNLGGGGSVLNDALSLRADRVLETQFGCLPTGRILPVAGTALDFTRPKPIGRDLFSGEEQLTCVGGYDHNFVFNVQPGKLLPVAELYSPTTGIGMTVRTDLPGLQLYSANFLTERAGKDGAVYAKYSGVCLETQGYPDAQSHANFPSIALEKGGAYHTASQYVFYVK